MTTIATADANKMTSSRDLIARLDQKNFGTRPLAEFAVWIPALPFAQGPHAASSVGSQRARGLAGRRGTEPLGTARASAGAGSALATA